MGLWVLANEDTGHIIDRYDTRAEAEGEAEKRRKDGERVATYSVCGIANSITEAHTQWHTERKTVRVEVRAGVVAGGVTRIPSRVQAVGLGAAAEGDVVTGAIAETGSYLS